MFSGLSHLIDELLGMCTITYTTCECMREYASDFVFPDQTLPSQIPTADE